MKKNKKSVSVKNTKSFLGNPPALVNTTFFVPAANLNSNDGIFTDLHDNPSNFSSSNQDPNWGFDISNKIFAQSGKKKIFSDDKFKNMISRTPDMQDTYTGDLFSDDFAPTRYPYEDVVREVSPVLADIYYPPYLTVEPQPVSVGVAPVDGDYFAPSNIFASREAGDTFMGSDVIKQAQASNSDFFVNNGATTMGDLLNQSNVSNSVLVSSYGDKELKDEIGEEAFNQIIEAKANNVLNSLTSPSIQTMQVEDLSLQDATSLPSDSIQPTTVEEDKKAKKPYNWLPLLLVAAAVGGYMYYNRKK